MTQAQNPQSVPSQATEPAGVIPVAVDPNFVRTFADQTVVNYLGRDLDISFLAFGARLNSVAGLSDDSTPRASVSVRPQLNEVARIRLSPITAITMAMQTINDLIGRDEIDVDELVKDIRAYEQSAKVGKDVPKKAS